MERLSLCKVNSDYLRQLHELDERVSSKYDKRPFVGIIVMVNEIGYVIPLTSQTTQEREKRGKTKRSTRITTFIKDDRGKEISNMLYNNMVPVPEGMYEYIKVDPSKDSYYMHEIRFIRKNSDKIINKARKVHDDRMTKHDPFLEKTCCDFRLLENKYLDFK